MGLAKRTFAIAAGAGAVASAVPVGLYGIHVREVTAVAAAGTLQVYDNAAAAAGTIVATIRLGVDGEFNVNWKKGVKIANGLFVQATGADLTGSLVVGGPGGLQALPFAGADLLLLTGARELDSILAAETAGAVAEWRMFDALSAAGTSFAGGVPAANETAKLEWPLGLNISTGLFFDNQAGAVSGNAYIG